MNNVGFELSGESTVVYVSDCIHHAVIQFVQQSLASVPPIRSINPLIPTKLARIIYD